MWRTVWHGGQCCRDNCRWTTTKDNQLLRGEESAAYRSKASEPGSTICLCRVCLRTTCTNEIVLLDLGSHWCRRDQESRHVPRIHDDFATSSGDLFSDCGLPRVCLCVMSAVLSVQIDGSCLSTETKSAIFWKIMFVFTVKCLRVCNSYKIALALSTCENTLHRLIRIHTWPFGGTARVAVVFVTFLACNTSTILKA